MTLVGAAIKRDGTPLQAFRKAVTTDRLALSQAVHAEITAVLSRPRLARFLDPALRADVLDLLLASAAWFETEIAVTDCRDAKDNRYRELALAAAARVIVSSDGDLLSLDPWRGVRILRPAACVAHAD